MGDLQKGFVLGEVPVSASASALPHTPLHPVPSAGPGLRNSVVFPWLLCLPATPQDHEVRIPPLRSRKVW